jgi:hypothetical protein
MLIIMLMLPPLHLFIKHEARQAAKRLLGNGCSYVLNFGHSEVLIKMTDEMPLLLDKFVTLNIFARKFSVDFPTREDWSTECVDLVELITVHCPLNKHLHNMGLIDGPICIACEMEDESAFHLLCNYPSLISCVEEYEGAPASTLLRFTLASGRITVTS